MEVVFRLDILCNYCKTLVVFFVLFFVTVHRCSCLLCSYTNDYSYEVKQATYTAVGVGTIFFVLMSICGGNAAVARYLEKDKATVHNTKFLAHVSDSRMLNICSVPTATALCHCCERYICN